MKDLIVIAATLLIILYSIGIAFNMVWLEIACIITLVPVISLGVRYYRQSGRHQKSEGSARKALIHDVR